ncbi:hypothetical protein MMC21_006645 [Puttea exsequens]|nr:hypothetical protein [Puttea exsequens]
MDGVSAVLAVVGVGIQLAKEAQKIRKILRDIKNAPEELQQLIDLLDRLHDILEDASKLVNQQKLPSGPNGLSVSVLKGFRNCEKTVRRLGAMVDEIRRSSDSGCRAQMIRGALKMVVKRDDIKQIQRKIQEDMMYLHNALSTHTSSYMQHTMCLTSSQLQ